MTNKLYTVAIPFTGYIVVDVVAGCKEEAIDEAFEEDFELIYQSNSGNSGLEDFELQTSICTGNVLHASLNEVDILNVEELLED